MLFPARSRRKSCNVLALLRREMLCSRPAALQTTCPTFIGRFSLGFANRVLSFANSYVEYLLGKLGGIAGTFSFADCHLVAGLSIPSYTAAVMKWGFTKSQGITISVIAAVALILLMIVIFRATSVH